MVSRGNISPASNFEATFSYRKNTSSSWSENPAAYCKLHARSCARMEYSAQLIPGSLPSRAYGETIRLWLIVAASLYRRIHHRAGRRRLGAISIGLWWLRSVCVCVRDRGCDHLKHSVQHLMDFSKCGGDVITYTSEMNRRYSAGCLAGIGSERMNRIKWAARTLI